MEMTGNRNYQKRIRKLVGIILISSTLSACLTPIFSKYLDMTVVQGEDVVFTQGVFGDPSAVGCNINNTDIEMTAKNGYVYEGTAHHSILFLGTNLVICSATNNMGDTTTAVGTIKVIENTPPTLSTIAAVQIYDYDGKIAINQPLVDTQQSQHLAGVEFTLDQSSDALPKGLSIDFTNGNLVGSVDLKDTDTLHLNLILRASNPAGSDTNDIPVQLQIQDSYHLETTDF